MFEFSKESIAEHEIKVHETFFTGRFNENTSEDILSIWKLNIEPLVRNYGEWRQVSVSIGDLRRFIGVNGQNANTETIAIYGLIALGHCIGYKVHYDDSCNMLIIIW